jgi:hypothetical protein
MEAHAAAFLEEVAARFHLVVPEDRVEVLSRLEELL